MHLYNGNHKVEQVDVRMDGELVYVGKEPYLLVIIRKKAN